MASAPTAYEQLKRLLKARLADLLDTDTRHGPSTRPDRDTIAARMRSVVGTLQGELRQPALSAPEQERLVAELVDEVIGLGPLEPLLNDPEITEVMVNGPSRIYVERLGRLERTAAAFRDSHHLMSVIERLLDRTGASVTEAEPCADASWSDGTRINVVMPPVAPDGPTVTIRKKLRQWTIEHFVSLDSMSPQAAEFLQACVKARVNLVISGGTSTGKTTLVSLLSSYIPKEERIITIENVGELEMPGHEHRIRLVVRLANAQGRGEISLRTLVRTALRMRPDRIILGEARGGEALDVVQAMHTGHEGVITVLHANAPQAALERLQTLMLMSGLDLPSQVCRMQIASAVDLIVHMTRHADGSRRIASIAQVLDSAREFQLEELFLFEVRGFRADGALEGGLRYTGARPKFAKKFQLGNVPLPAWMAPGT